jgi:hypothetical protein
VPAKELLSLELKRATKTILTKGIPLLEHKVCFSEVCQLLYYLAVLTRLPIMVFEPHFPW